MEFRFEDILKNIIPGFVLLVGLIFFFYGGRTYDEFQKFISSGYKDYSEVILVLLLIICYLLGFLADAVGSRLEKHCIYAIFGTPSLKLLQNKGRRIKLVNYQEILNNIVLKCHLTSVTLSTLDRAHKIKSTTLLFQHANSLKDLNPNEKIKEKVKEYYFSYIFSRNILFAYLISFILIIFSIRNLLTTTVYVFLIITLFILFLRRMEKSFYYSRQVLIASYYSP